MGSDGRTSTSRSPLNINGNTGESVPNWYSCLDDEADEDNNVYRGVVLCNVNCGLKKQFGQRDTEWPTKCELSDFTATVPLDLPLSHAPVEEDWNKGNDKEDDSARPVYYES